MFIDTAKIFLKAGKGGDGAVSFHREKYVAAGGPDGGDGGRGGNIVFVADPNLSTLMDFRYKRKYAAPCGENGRGARCNGKNAQDLVIRVPRGTLVKEAESGLVIADISTNEPVVVAKGGKGGWGNVHFATPTRQIPRFAKPGLPGEELEVQLELKLIADVGLIGFPNVGKSTLISAISAAKPKIANYHFTTLSPVLGVVRVGPEASFVAADIPGLIEGAADGVGLGHDFLRHVERCRMLLHVAKGGTQKRILPPSMQSCSAFRRSLPRASSWCWATSATLPAKSRLLSSAPLWRGRGLPFCPFRRRPTQALPGCPAWCTSACAACPRW